MLRPFAVGLCCIVLHGCGDFPRAEVAAQASQPSALRRGDSSLVWRLSGEEVTAVELAKLALHRSHSARIMGYARRAVSTHQGLQGQLRGVAKAEGGRLTTSMTQAGQDAWSALFQHSGKVFDSLFLQQQQIMQERALHTLSAARNEAAGDALQDWAADAWAAWQAEKEALITL